MKNVIAATGWTRELDRKIARLAAERIAPLLTMTAVLPMAGISIGTSTAATISACTTLVNFTLQTTVLDRLKDALDKRGSFSEYCLLAAVNHSLAALAVFKVFELVTR